MFTQAYFLILFFMLLLLFLINYHHPAKVLKSSKGNESVAASYLTCEKITSITQLRQCNKH